MGGAAAGKAAANPHIKPARGLMVGIGLFLGAA